MANVIIIIYMAVLLAVVMGIVIEVLTIENFQKLVLRIRPFGMELVPLFVKSRR